jgi:hypothetical protein
VELATVTVSISEDLIPRDRRFIKRFARTVIDLPVTLEGRGYFWVKAQEGCS